MKKLFTTYYAIFILALFSTTSFSQDISLSMASPNDGDTFNIGDNINITISVTNTGLEVIEYVQLYQNGFWMADLSPDTTEYLLETAPNGVYRFSAVAVVDSLTSYSSDTVTVNVGSTPENDRIVNGEFNNTSWPWRFDNYSGAESTLELTSDLGLTDDAPGIKISYVDPGQAQWQIQLMQQFKLVEGHSYIISFTAKADQNKDIQVTFSRDYDPWTPHWEQNITVGTDVQEYGPFLYTPDFNDPLVMFKFIIGGDDTPLYIDGVKILDTQGGGSSDDITLDITDPANETAYDVGDDITINLEVTNNSDVGISALTLYQNGFVLGNMNLNDPTYTFENAPNGVYRFYVEALDNNGAKAYSDTVVANVGNTDPNDKVINGEFNVGKWPWRFDNYVGAAGTFELYDEAGITEDSSAGYIQISEVGDQFWGVQLMQPFQLKAGYTYEVSFVAWATAEKPIQTVFAMDYDPYASHWWEDITLAAEPAEYGPYTFVCEVDDPKVMFKFIIGGNTIPMFLDAVKVIEKKTVTSVAEENKSIPLEFTLEQNYPNPFNPSTNIGYTLKENTNVELNVFNLLGEKVASIVNAEQEAGYHQVRFDASNLSAGIYFYRISTSGGFIQTKKLMLVK
ncbi:MAG: carbohydrate binding domain-containing protein [Melioribacteraceae bacterium]|nr:carbohydrate binding domain-containing protein [Melioribacteraceae bacterium]MCF8432596.1 carbohydrate binding domain-containing protein [Melioribacteraceae bacterium]